jgi:hydrogenase expression/formation protein HypC
MCLAVPGKILSIIGDDPLQRVGRIDFGGIIKQINLVYVPEAKIDDYVLVHVGFAITCLDVAQAALMFEQLQALGSLQDLEVPQHEVS